MIAHIEIGPQRRPWAGSFLKRCVSILLSAVLFMQPVLVNAQSVSASAAAPGSNQPGIGAAPNGVPLVDIVTPNAQGLSHNKYDRFNVGQPGLILNNYNGEVGTSLLGGVTPGNANLRQSGPATVILNEVTSGSRSQLLGPTEVFGGRADVIIANPNGITCDGCGFINTPRTTLTTGTPDIGADGRLNGVTVRDGDVTIGTKGGNFAAGQGAVDLFDIVSRSVRIDGPVHARDLRITAGRNKVGYASGDITPLEATTGTPEFAIDGSALGAMQADRIKIVVTEKGAGVRMRGNMAANVGELSLSADGKISIGNASGADGVKLNSKAKIEAGKVTSKKRVVAKADRGITLQSVAADSDIELASGLGLLSVAGDTSALGSIMLNSSGGISVDNLDAGDSVSVRSDAGDVKVRGSAKAGGDITVSAASGALSAGSLVSFRNLTLDAGLDIGISGELLAQGNISAAARSIRSSAVVSGIDLTASRAGKTVLGGAGNLTFSANETIESASLLAAGHLDATANSLKLGEVRGHGAVRIVGDVDARGQILGAGDVLIDGRTIVADTIASGVDFAASTQPGAGLSHGASGILSLLADTGNVNVRALASAGQLIVTAGELSSQGISARGAIDIKGNVTVGGQILGGNDIVVSGKRIAVDTLVSGVDFAGTTAGGRIALTDRGNITINAASGEVRGGTMLAAGTLKATAGQIAAKDLSSRGNVDLSGDVAVSGRISGAGRVHIDGRSIAATSIAAGSASKLADLSLVARDGSIKADVLESTGQLTVDAAQLEARTIAGRSNVDVTSGNATVGQLFAGKNLGISGGNFTFETLIAGLDFDRTDAAGGKAMLAGDGGIIINAASGTVKATTLMSAADLSATVGGLVAGTVKVHGNIELSGNADVAKEMLASGNVAVSGNTIKAGTVASGVDFAATDAGGGAIALSDRGNLTIDAASGSVEVGAVLTAGDFTSRSDTLTAKSITAHGAVAINGSTAIDGSLLAQGNVTIHGRSIRAGAIASGVDFTATKRSASGNIVLGPEGTLTLNATSGQVTAGTLLSAGDLSATAGKIVASNITGRRDIRLTGETEARQILGGRDIVIGGGLKATSIASGVDFAATEAGNGSIALSDRGNLTIDATSGNVDAGTVLNAGALDSRSKTFTARSVTAHGAVSIDGTTAIDGSLLGQGNVAIRGDSIRAGAIVSGVDFAAIKRSGSGNIILASDGALTLTALSGDVTTGMLLSAGDLDVSASKIAASNITGRKDIRLSGETEAGQVLGGRDITIAGSKVKAGSIAAGVDFAATGTGAIALAGRGNLAIQAASGSVDAGTVLTAGSLDSKSDSFAARSVTANGAVSIEGSAAIDGSLLSQGNVTIRGGSIRAGAIVSGVDFAATRRSASGNIVLGADGALTLVATSGNVTSGSLLSAGDLAATASKIAVTNITGRKDIRLTGETEASQILGARDIAINGGRVKATAIAAGVDFAATEAGSGAIALSDRGNLTINAVAGPVETGSILTAGNFTSNSATFSAKSVTTHGAVSIEGSTAIDGSLLARNGITVRGGSISAGAIVAGVDFDATKRSAAGNIVLGAGGALTLVATSGNLTSGSLLSAGDLVATASKVAVANITGRNDIRLAGDLESSQILGGRDVAITGNRVKATAIAAGVDFAATETGNGAIALSNRGNLTINAIAGPVETGSILTAGNFTSSSATFAANSVTAHGAVSIDGSTVIGGSLLGRNAVNIRGGSISAGAIVSGVDFAATKRSPSGNIVLGADGTLTLAATAGNVTAGTLLSSGDLTVSAANSVSAQATSRRNLTVDANGSIRLTGQTLAGSDISLRADAVTVDTLVSGVDFAATEASSNGTLALKGQGKLTLAASSADVAASSLVSAGQMDVSANRNVSYGSLQSFNSARLASANGSISLDRTTRSAGDMTLVARSVDLSGNRGRIATGGTLAITADNASFAGSSYTFGGLDLRLVGRADFSGASINAVRRSGGSGDVKIVASGIDQNAATILLAERDIALTLARLDNAGQIAAGRDLSVSAGNLSNGPTGLIYAGNDINLLVGGDILNDRGAIMAGGDLTIAGATADRNGASLTNISGLIQAASDVSIRTDRLVNRRIANPTFTRDVVVASDVKTGFELNPDVAGKPYAFLFGRSSDGRELYPGIGPQFWADYEPQLWSQAKTADGGSYRAWTWISGNGPKWVGEISRWIRDRVPRDANGVPIYGSDNPSRHFIVQYVNPGADSSTTYSWDFDANISQTIHEDRIADAGGPQAMIRAGRNLDVTATNLTNSYSAIEADGNATLRGSAFSNEGLALNRTVQTTCNARGACEAYDAQGNRDPSRDIAAGTSIISKVETTGVEAGTVKAGGHLDISGFATFSNTAADRSVAGSAKLAPTTKSGDPLAALAGLTAGGALFTPNAALLGVAQGAGLTAGSELAAPTTTFAGERTTVAMGPALSASGSSVSAASGLSADGGKVSGGGPAATTGATVVAAVQSNTPGATAPVADALSGNLKEAPQVDVDRLASLAKPESGGFGGTIPGQVFLFETRAAFLDVGKFYGSGYYLDRVGYQPDTRVPFLGDAYFENQLIDRQIRQQTGLGLGGTFDPAKDAIEEMKLLLDNGIAYVKENKLSIGERLSPEQIARLTQSIVLYEKQVVQGVEVLAPVVYLANADKAKLTASGALIAGGSVTMDVGRLDNSGAIAARTDLSIKATDIKVDGGSFKAGGNVQLASTGDLTFTAQSLDIGGMNVVNPNAAIVAGGNATLLANDGLKLQGATIDAAGNVALSAGTITLDALKVDNAGSQNATGSAIKAGGNLTIAGNSDVSIIGSGTKAGKDLTITSQGSVNVVSTDVTGKTDDGYKTVIVKRQQDGQLVSGGSTTVNAGSDILISGSSIRSGADVTLKAADDINITAAQETTSERFGKSQVSTERHQSSEIKAAGSITANAGEGTGDHDLNIVGSKLEAKERVTLKAEGDLTIAEARNSETGDYVWDGGGDKTKSHEAAQTSVRSSVSGGGGVSTRSGGDTLVSATTLEAGTKDRKADLTVSAGGDLVVTSGKDTYEKHAQSERKGFLSKTSASEDRQHETTVASELGASGNVTLNAGDDVAIAGSNIDAGQSVSIEGDNVAIIGAEEKHADAEQKKKSGLFAGSGDGFISLWGKEQKDSRKTATENVGSAITAGEDVTVKAREGDVAVIGSAIEAERDIRLEAARDVNITPGAESSSSEEKEKRSGFGIAYSSGNGGASIGIGYGSKKDEVRQSAETNSRSQLAAGRDVTINAGRDANLQAAKVEAERDVAITAQRDVNLLSAQDRSNFEEVHEQLFAGVTLSVSSSLVSAGQSVGEAAEQVASGSGTYSVANAAFAGLQAYKALKDLSEISKTGEVGLSASLTAGFSYSKNSSKAESSVPVVSAVRAGQSVVIDAVSGDINGTGAQIVAGRDALGLPNLSGSETAGDITLKAGKDINLESAVATSSSSQKNSGVSAGVGIGGSIGIGPAGVSDNLGLMAFAGGNKGSSNDNATAHVNSHVTGTGDVTLKSGTDTSLKGATVTGRSVTADVGGDLKIESQVDTTTAKVKQTSGGITVTSTGFEASGSKQKASGDVAVVNEQSGIHAGTGGFDIDVEGTTSLKGGLVTSDAAAEKNRIETGKLEWQDVDTHSKWKAESYSGMISSGGATMTPPQKAGESETGKALTAVAPGTIVITDPSGQTQNLDDLRRDTANTNTSLPGLPDLQNILQQQYKTQEAYQEASAIMAGLVGDIADGLAEEAQRRGNKEEEKMWAAGGLGRAALHAVGGGLLGGVNDVSGMIKGAFGGATSVLIAPYIDQLVKGLINDTNLAGTPAGQSLANVISSGLVMGLTGVVGGGDAAAYAGAEFKYNYLTHKERGEFNRTLAACEGGDKAACAHVEELQQLSASRDTKLDSCAGNSTAECVKARRDLRIAAAEYLDAALAKGGDNLDALSLLDRHFVFLAASQHADANDAWDNRDLASAQNGLKSDAAKKLLTANKDQTWGILRDPIILGAILYGGVGNAKTTTGNGSGEGKTKPNEHGGQGGEETIGGVPRGPSEVILQVPGRVQSRINLQIGTTKFGMTHVRREHMSGKPNKSQFTISEGEVRALLQSKSVVNSPIVKILESRDHGRLYVRQADVLKPIGTDYLKGHQSTSILTIQTDKFGNIVTAFPGR
ncbi:hemagglutinin repeat-containing protein [Ensifer adhaerens]|uniref:hemagglutinin repeat-containing protein n=1 Tax=Ensifer adhaerens TaxID=106592 RepID=UPI00131A252A|nr:hemagglutinin repeat-containing protein [Ensifer adhaerens]